MATATVKRFLFLIGVVALSLLAAPRLLPAGPTPGESGLTDAQKALLGAGVAEKKSPAELIRQALAEGMDCEEVVVFLCGKSGNGATAVFDIVYAAITGGCDAEKVVSGALRSGAGLDVVVRSARAAGASREAIAAGATKNGFSPVQISNAFAGISGGGAAGAGPSGDGPIAGSSSSGTVIGGGAGGAAAASPYKP